MGANTDPQSMRAAVDQLEAAKRSRSERAGANERREAKPAPGGPSGGGSDDWLGNFYRDNNIGGRGGSLDNEARDYWTKEAQTRGRDAVMDTIRGTAQDQGTWGGPREPMPEKPPRKGWPNRPPEFGEQEGRPGIRPPKPPRDEPKIPERPPGGRDEVRIQPFPFPGDIARPLPWFPPRGDDQIGPGKPFPGRPIGDDQPIRGDDQYGPGRPFPGFPGFPGRPPGKPPRDVMPDRPKEPPWMDGRPPKKPPVEEHPWGREDDPNYSQKKDLWHQKRRDEDRRRMEFKKELMKRRGGIDFGPGRGGRVDRDVTRKQMEAGTDAPVPGGEFLNPEEGLKGQEYMAFMERLLRQKQGQFDR
jgi:hypothetical protein